jgi:hypothetical protein
VAAALGRLLDSSAVAASCRQLADRFPVEAQSMERACDAIETFARREAVVA